MTLTAYASDVAESEDADAAARARTIADSAHLPRLCRRWGFIEVSRPSKTPFNPEGEVCPSDGLPARLLTFSNSSTTIAKAAMFAGAVRLALGRRVQTGKLARASVDAWGSWRLTSLHRYENYYDFDADSPYRFMIGVSIFVVLKCMHS